MANDLLKSLAQFFSCAEKCDQNWSAMCERLKPTVNVLRNQAEYLRAITSYECDNLELFESKEMRDRLTFKTFCLLTEAVQDMKQEFMKIQSENQELRNKLKNMERIRSKVSLNDPEMEDVLKGTPERPELNTLLGHSLYVYDYHSKLISKSLECLDVVDYKEPKSIENLAQSLVQDFFQLEKLKKIFCDTQFLVKASRC